MRIVNYFFHFDFLNVLFICEPAVVAVKSANPTLGAEFPTAVEKGRKLLSLRGAIGASEQARRRLWLLGGREVFSLFPQRLGIRLQASDSQISPRRRLVHK